MKKHQVARDIVCALIRQTRQIDRDLSTAIATNGKYSITAKFALTEFMTSIRSMHTAQAYLNDAIRKDEKDGQ